MNIKNLVNLLKIVCLKNLTYILGFSSIGMLIGLPSIALESPELCQRKLIATDNYRKENTDLLTILEEEKKFDNLVYELKKARLTEIINQGNYILLAPNDEAFEALSEEQYVKYFESANSERVLKYHLIVPKDNKQNKSRGEIKTVEGNTIFYSRHNGKVTVNTANAEYPCISATNGLIIEIDRVLLPPDF